MWAAHLIFHLGTGLPSLFPALQQAMGDFASLPAVSVFHCGGRVIATLQPCYPLGMPLWAKDSSIQPRTLEQIQFLLLDGGLLVSLYAGWRLAQQIAQDHGRPLLMWIAWSAVVVCLYGFGLWILTQPMEMRGMVMS
jgi:hypothetical protein